MGFSRQEYWSGWPFPSPGDLPDPGIKPAPPPWRQIPTTGPPGNSLGCLSAKRLFWRSLDWSWVLNIENMGKQREKEGGIPGTRHSLSEQRQSWTQSWRVLEAITVFLFVSVCPQRLKLPTPPQGLLGEDLTGPPCCVPRARQ